MAEMRLQRFLAHAGLASRRRAEELILAGRVTVNGQVIRTLGTKVDTSRDRVVYEGQRIIAEEHVWLLLNKPTKCVSTADDPEGRETVLDLIGPQGVRLYPVGRLDYNTEGVLLLTNDGDLANALMHPKNQIPRVYHVKIKGLVATDLLDRLREGVPLDTGETVQAQVSILATTGKHTWLEMILREGRNRQIHRMLDSVELQVLKLIRVAYGQLTVEGLRPGRFRSLTQSEVTELRTLVNLRGETRRSTARPPGRRNRQGPAKPKSGKTARPARPAPRRSGPRSRHRVRRSGDRRSGVRNAKRGPEKRGPEKRGPEKRGPEKRSPEKRSPEKRGPEKRGPEKRGPRRAGPHKRRSRQKPRPERRGPQKPRSRSSSCRTRCGPCAFSNAIAIVLLFSGLRARRSTRASAPGGPASSWSPSACVLVALTIALGG